MSVLRVGYRRFVPPARLRDVVEHAWVCWSVAGTREALLPDGRGLVLVVGEPAAWVSDPLTGVAVQESSVARGPALNVEVRETTRPGVRLGLQLTPVGLARLWVPDHAHVGPGPRPAVPASTVLGAEAVATITDALGTDDDAAVAAAWVAVGAVLRPDSDDVDRLTQALALARSARGLVRGPDLAREAGASVNELHRWCWQLLGMSTSQWLSAVRFSAFVREYVGSGPVRVDDLVSTLRWYLAAGYSPREAERFTGLPPAELRRLADRLEQSARAA